MVRLVHIPHSNSLRRRCIMLVINVATMAIPIATERLAILISTTLFDLGPYIRDNKESM